MSRGRLQDVWDELHSAGWQLLNEEPFAMDVERIVWRLVHEVNRREATICFFAFGDLGQLTSDLRDILYCKEPAEPRKLFFDKRQSSEWKANLTKFVREIRGTPIQMASDEQ